jgi:hypothetical protein
MDLTDCFLLIINGEPNLLINLVPLNAFKYNSAASE